MRFAISTIPEYMGTTGFPMPCTQLLKTNRRLNSTRNRASSRRTSKEESHLPSRNSPIPYNLPQQMSTDTSCAKIGGDAGVEYKKAHTIPTHRKAGFPPALSTACEGALKASSYFLNHFFVFRLTQVFFIRIHLKSTAPLISVLIFRNQMHMQMTAGIAISTII